MESINEVLLLGLAEPEYSRVEFWQIRQRESGFSPLVFWTKLNEVWQQYHDLIEMKIKEINSWGNSVTDYGISLMLETNMKLKGHLDRDGLNDLWLSLFEYGVKLKGNDWLYEYPERMDRIQVSKEYCPSKQFAVFGELNVGMFSNELAQQEPDKIGGFLDFHFRCYLRKIKRHTDFEALRESWLKKTLIHKPVNFTAKQKDCFFQWFEKLEELEEAASESTDTLASKAGEVPVSVAVGKPIMKSEAVKIVFAIIKDFFPKQQQAELKRRLATGESGLEKLQFNDNSNRLSDLFKKLFEFGFIVGCQKRELISWIIQNFTYRNKGVFKEYVFDTVEKVISRNHYPCKNPLIEIQAGKITKVENPIRRNQNW